MIGPRRRQPETAAAALQRSERLRYAQVNRELRHLRFRLMLRRITDAQYEAEAKALMESLEGWAPPAPTTHPHLDAERQRFAQIEHDLDELQRQREDGRITVIEFHQRSAALMREGADYTPADATPTHRAAYSRDYRPASREGRPESGRSATRG